MENLEKLFIKHRVISDGLYRRYLINAFERRYDLEGSRPIYLHVLNGGDSFKQIVLANNWAKLLRKVVEYLQELSPKSIEEMITFRTDWSKSEIFSKNKMSVNAYKLENGLFLNINHTALHSQWLAGDLLKFYGVEQTYLLIHKAHITEPEDIKNEVIKVRKEEFKSFLTRNNVNPNEVIKTIDIVNKIFSKMGYSYNNFYFFDEKACFLEYKRQFINKCKNYVFLDDKQKAFINKCLTYLYRYFSQIKTEETAQIDY